MLDALKKRSAEELNYPPERGTPEAVAAARTELTAAKAQVAKLQGRITTLHGEAAAARIRDEAHRQAVARALADDLPPPVIPISQRDIINPKDAILILEAELAAARIVLQQATGDHRAAVVGWLKLQRAGRIEQVAVALDAYRTALIEAVAADRILVGMGISPGISPTIHQTLVFGLAVADGGPGQVLNGRSLMASSDIAEAAFRQRRAACKALGEGELPV